MKLKLQDPPEGFSEDAEYREPLKGEWVIWGTNAVQIGIDNWSPGIVLTKLPEPEPQL